MATSTPNTDSTDEPLADRANVGSDEMAGGPEPIGDTAPPVPTGSGEPAKQAVSATASPAGQVVAPTASEYEMPDDYANESPVDKVKSWAEEHPGLALLAAGGIGLVVGRILIGITPDPEPPSLAARVEKRAKVFKKQAKGSYAEAKDSAGDAAAASAAALAAAAVALREAAENAGHRAGGFTEDGVDRAKHLAEDGVDKAKELADVISDAVRHVVDTGVDGWLKKIRG